MEVSGRVSACQQLACTRLLGSTRSIRVPGHGNGRCRRGFQIVAWGKKNGIETKQVRPQSPASLGPDELSYTLLVDTLASLVPANRSGLVV